MPTGDLAPHHLQRYADLLNEMAERIDAAQRFLGTGHDWPLARAAAGELRGALELLIFGGLLAHREVIPQAETALANANRKEARRLVRSANPAWWPKPVVTFPNEIKAREGDDWLSEAQWDSFHSRTSSVLHVRNPYALATAQLPTTEAWLSDLIARLVNLMTAHWIEVGQDHAALLGQIGPPGEVPRVHVDTFEAV